MKRAVKKTTITHIHESIIIHILCFLPADMVLRCRSVCKSWATSISSPWFAEAYSLTRTAPLQFLLHATISNTNAQLLLAAASCNSHDYPDPFSKSVLPNILNPESSLNFSPNFNICSVCNFTGFIALRDIGRNKPYIILNPITSQLIVVQHYEKSGLSKQCALLYAHKTNQLKLLVTFYGQTESDIQTIGSGFWRKIRFGHYFIPDTAGFPCYINGIYHWYSGYSGRKVIVCFNPEEEIILGQMPSPPCVENNGPCPRLGLLDGCLCICTQDRIVKSYEFSVMNEYGVSESWTKKFVISSVDIVKMRMKRISGPLVFLKNGEIVVQNRGGNLVCYNPSTRKHKTIMNDEKDNCHLSSLEALIPYIPNFRRVIYI